MRDAGRPFPCDRPRSARPRPLRGAGTGQHTAGDGGRPGRPGRGPRQRPGDGRRPLHGRTGGQPARRTHPQLVRSVVAFDPAHGAHGLEVDGIPGRLAAYREQRARAAADFVAAAFSPQAPPGLRTAHLRTLLGTPDHVIAQAYAGMYTDPGAVGIRAHSEAYLRRRPHPALTVRTSAEAADWERNTLACARFACGPLARRRALPARGMSRARHATHRGVVGYCMTAAQRSSGPRPGTMPAACRVVGS